MEVLQKLGWHLWEEQGWWWRLAPDSMGLPSWVLVGLEDMIVERMDRLWSHQATEASGPAGAPPGWQCSGAPRALSWVAAEERKGRLGEWWQPQMEPLYGCFFDTFKYLEMLRLFLLLLEMCV